MQTGLGTDRGFDIEWLRAAVAVFDNAVGYLDDE
jgi:hypothetical protein